ELVWALDPKSDDFSEVATYLKDFGEQYFAHTPLAFVVDEALPNAENDLRLPPGWSRQLILIFKEAMTNVLKHAGAGRVRLTMRTPAGGGIRIELRDDGVGVGSRPEGGGEHTGFGLRNMRQRAREIGCCLEIETQKDGGTSVVLTGEVPLKGYAQKRGKEVP
ncbi:MAG: ATP-binding protein, partial [Catalinimonas sp.]